MRVCFIFVVVVGGPKERAHTRVSVEQSSHGILRLREPVKDHQKMCVTVWNEKYTTVGSTTTTTTTTHWRLSGIKREVTHLPLCYIHSHKIKTKKEKNKIRFCEKPRRFFWEFFFIYIFSLHLQHLFLIFLWQSKMYSFSSILCVCVGWLQDDWARSHAVTYSG